MPEKMPTRAPRLGLLIMLLSVGSAVGLGVAFFAVLGNVPNPQRLMTPMVVTMPPQLTGSIEARVAAADPSKGAAVFEKYACNACHRAEDGVGPALTGMGKRAALRRPNYSPAAYIYESIIEPNAFIVPDYANVMVSNYKAKISEVELFDLIAWLLQQ
ncbi:MAG: c-type cytochrome [Chloroflexi bacterium]|jgi:mono/diheme cytochrome c family protein|nr:c-type cytochrome [Chloroflexota bacterium]